MDDVFRSNPSYVFFKISDNGATELLNTVLTVRRNLAVDEVIFLWECQYS